MTRIFVDDYPYGIFYQTIIRNTISWFSAIVRWCIGAVLGLLLCGEVSGGHINPAVTVALATLGKFPWRRVPHYLAAQYLGAFLASAAVFLVYWDALVWYEHDRGRYRATPDTAAIFGTYPAPHLTLWGGVGDQLLGTGLLLLCVCAITDRNNMRVSRHVSAITCPVPRATCVCAGSWSPSSWASPSSLSASASASTAATPSTPPGTWRQDSSPWCLAGVGTPTQCSKAV